MCERSAAGDDVSATGRGNGLGKERSSLVQSTNHGRFIGPAFIGAAAHGLDSTAESTVPKTTTRHSRNSIRAGL